MKIKETVKLLPPPTNAVESNDLMEATRGNVVDAEFTAVPEEPEEVLTELHAELKEANERNEENPDKYPTVDRLYTQPATEDALHVSFSEFSQYIVQEVGYTIKAKANKVKRHLHLLFTNPAKFGAKFNEWGTTKGQKIWNWTAARVTALDNWLGKQFAWLKRSFKTYFAGSSGSLEKEEFHLAMELLSEQIAEQSEAFANYIEANERTMRRVTAQLAKLKGEPTKEEKERLAANKAKADAAAAKREAKAKAEHDKAIVDFGRAISKGHKTKAAAIYQQLTGSTLASAKEAVNGATA